MTTARGPMPGSGIPQVLHMLDPAVTIREPTVAYRRKLPSGLHRLRWQVPAANHLPQLSGLGRTKRSLTAAAIRQPQDPAPHPGRQRDGTALLPGTSMHRLRLGYAFCTPTDAGSTITPGPMVEDTVTFFT